MLDQMNAELRPVVEPFVGRYEAFDGKIRARAKEIFEEADEGLDELIQAAPLDPNALAAGFNAVSGRLHGLDDKVSSAMEKIEEEWEEATDDLDLEPDQNSLLYRAWFGLVNKSRELQSDLERLREQIEMKKNADWARVLWKMAEQEMAKPRACPSCGSPIEPTIQHAHQTIACPHCGSANEPSMGQATGLYYQGLGVHALAREAAWDLWVAQHKAEQAYNFWRHPSDDDRKTYLNAVAAYETAYFEKTTALHPGFDKTVEQAVAERLAHHETYDNSEEKTERAAYGQFLRLASAGDRAGIESQLDSNDDLEASDVVEAVHEHGDRKATQLMLEIQYKRDDEDDDQAEWIAERFKELDEDLSTR